MVAVWFDFTFWKEAKIKTAFKVTLATRVRGKETTLAILRAFTQNE